MRWQKLPKRIDPEIDKLILVDASLGELNKDIAQKYGVSPSYVSKLTTGKKSVQMQMPDLRTIIDGDVEVNEDDMDAMLLVIADKKFFLSELDIDEYLSKLVQKSLIRLKIYVTIQNKLKEKNK